MTNETNKERRTREITEHYRPIVQLFQRKIAEYYGELFADMIDKIDGFDVNVSFKVDVYPSKESNSKVTSIRYEHDYLSREFLTKSYRENLKKEVEDGEESDKYANRTSEESCGTLSV